MQERKKVKAQAEYWPISELTLLENNPRTIKKDDMERLKTSIKNNPDYFEARPVIISNRTGKNVIIAGNQRLRAAEALKMTEVPAVLLEGLTSEREQEIIIRDNVSNGDWDTEILANNFDIDALDIWGVKMPSWGDDIDKFDDEETTSEKKMQKIVCPNCGKEFEI